MSAQICIRGDGAVGMALALGLSHQGIPLILQGAGPASAAPDLRAYAINATSKQWLTQLRVWDSLPKGSVTPIEHMRIQGDERGLLQFSAWQTQQEALGWIVESQALLDTLRQAIQFAPTITQQRSEPQNHALQHMLTILCEGKDSPSRQRLHLAAGHGPFSTTNAPYPHSALALRVQPSVAAAGRAWQWFSHGDVLALLPCQDNYAVVWSMPHEQAQRRSHLAHADLASELNAATQGLAGELLPITESTAWPLRLSHDDPVWGLGSALSPSQSAPAWVLVGDAAHAVHPLAGQGLNLGLADAQALSNILGQERKQRPWRPVSDTAPLARYARQRRWPTERMLGTCDALWQTFAQQHAWASPLRSAGMNVVNAMPGLKRWLVGQALRG